MALFMDVHHHVEGLTAEGEPTDNVFGEVAGESSDERIAGQ